MNSYVLVPSFLRLFLSPKCVAGTNGNVCFFFGVTKKMYRQCTFVCIRITHLERKLSRKAANRGRPHDSDEKSNSLFFALVLLLHSFKQSRHAIRPPTHRSTHRLSVYIMPFWFNVYLKEAL